MVMGDSWKTLSPEQKHATWRNMSAHEKLAVIDLSDTTPQLEGLAGWRVEVVRMDGTKARFMVGRSTGWQPCHLELHNARSSGGIPADHEYRSVIKLRKVR